MHCAETTRGAAVDRFELAVTRLFQERRQLFWRQRCEQFGA
jgi:hypothetical protein